MTQSFPYKVIFRTNGRQLLFTIFRSQAKLPITLPDLRYVLIAK